ncbi:MAG: hypothetical protein FWD13_13075 [Treponema sp.]|nr:hypothetical protein [Treponema sp.]
MAWKKQYVSGQWIEVIVNTNNEVSNITDMELKCDISEITVQGKCHLPDEYAQKKGMLVSYYTFDSVCSKFDFDGHTLYYSFIQKGITKDPKPFYGYLDFISTCKNGLFDKYIGNFYDGENYLNVFAI